MAGKNIKLEIGKAYKKSADGCYYFRYQVNGHKESGKLKNQ